MTPLFSRHVEPFALEALASFPATVVQGARQAGKSTFAQQLVSGSGDTNYLLDNTGIPVGFAENSSHYYVTDHLDSVVGIFAADGTYRFGARYYDPSIGRFTQMDPSGQEANPYSYASCNPVNASDPTGLMTTCAAVAGTFGVISFVAGGVALVATAPTVVGAAGAISFMTAGPALLMSLFAPDC